MRRAAIGNGLLALSVLAAGACSRKRAPPGASDAATATPHHVRGFHFSVTVPAGWRLGPTDGLPAGTVLLAGPDDQAMGIGRVRKPATEARDLGACRAAADRTSDAGNKLVSAEIVQGTRFGAACRTVHRDSEHRMMVSHGFAVGVGDTLYFICWRPGTTPELSPTCRSVFDSIELED